jgi:hypothetical protein
VPSVLFALVLLSSVAAAAQVTVGDEIVSGSLPVQIAPVSLAAPAVALARDHVGVAIAWTMANSPGVDAADRVYVTRIDESGNGGGITREMPLASAAARTNEVYPSLAAAPDGNGFIAVWLEVDPSNPMTARAVFSRLDVALTPSAPTTLSPALLPVAPTVVRTKNSKSWISAGGFVWSLDGTMEGPIAGLIASDMTIATDVPQLVGSHPAQDKSYYTCSPATGCVVLGGPFRGFCQDLPGCRIYPFRYALEFVSVNGTLVSKTFDFLSDAQPAIASNGSDVAVVWFRGAQSSGGDVVMTRAPLGEPVNFDHPRPLAAFAGDFGQTRPDIAADGQRYLIVWRTQTSPGNHDIAGMVVDNDGKQTPISIAASFADERDPSILALGGGTFFVVYEKIIGFERRIAGRFVTFGRRRAAR